MTSDPNRRAADQADRFHFVDALRGLAALAVLAFHVHSAPLEQSLRAVLPVPVSFLCDRGWLGVQVFFVLSGFVIAHSLRRVGSTAGFVGRFLLRRAARLDPPYWAAIALALGSGAMASQLLANHRFEPPSVPAAAAHLVYLQGILGYPQILDVFWTLCIELQLYLMLAVVLVARERLGSTDWARPFLRAATVATFTIALLASLASGLVPEAARKVWFISYWYQFFLGAVTSWVASRRLAAGWWLAVAACVALWSIVQPAETLVCLATASCLALAAAHGRLSTWLAAFPFRWLGRISYSLYLTHPVVCSRVVNAARRLGVLEGREVLVAALAFGLALVFADLFWRVVERPAVELSRRVPLWPRPAASATIAAGGG